MRILFLILAPVLFIVNILLLPLLLFAMLAGSLSRSPLTNWLLIPMFLALLFSVFSIASFFGISRGPHILENRYKYILTTIVIADVLFGLLMLYLATISK